MGLYPAFLKFWGEEDSPLQDTSSVTMMNLQENVSFGLQMQPEQLVVHIWPWKTSLKTTLDLQEQNQGLQLVTEGCGAQNFACFTYAYWHGMIQWMNEFSTIHGSFIHIKNLIEFHTRGDRYIGTVVRHGIAR